MHQAELLGQEALATVGGDGERLVLGGDGEEVEVHEAGGYAAGVEDGLVVLLGEHLEGGEGLLGHVHALDHLEFLQQGRYRLHNH